MEEDQKGPREKGKRRGSWGGNTEERGRAVKAEGGVSRKTSVQLGGRTRWVLGQDSEEAVPSREPDDREAEAYRMAAGARGEQRGRRLCKVQGPSQRIRGAIGAPYLLRVPLVQRG